MAQRLGLLIALIAVGAAGSAEGQEPARVAPPAATAAAVPVAASIPEPARQAARDRARGIYRRGTRLSQWLAALLDEARRRHDRRWARCLDETLTQSNATLRVVELRTAELSEALARGDRASAAHLLRILSVLRERMDDLEMAAYLCPGSGQRVRQGRTTVEVTVR